MAINNLVFIGNAPSPRARSLVLLTKSRSSGSSFSYIFKGCSGMTSSSFPSIPTIYASVIIVYPQNGKRAVSRSDLQYLCWPSYGQFDDIVFLYMLFVLQFLQALVGIFDWSHVLCRDQRQELLVGERCLLPLAELILC